MNNKFGLKDFVLITLVLLVGFAVFLAMKQSDRTFAAMRQLESKFIAQEQALARLEAGTGAPAAGSSLDAAQLQLLQAQTQSAQAQTALLWAMLNQPLGVQPRPEGSAPSFTPPSNLTPPAGLTPPLANQGQAPGARDESWARPGVPVVWQGAPVFTHEPRQAEGARAGGEFVWSIEAQPSKLTPVLGEDTYGRYVQDLVCESLGEFDPETLEMRGMLAEAWQYDPAGMWLRVKIRDNARFDDGTPVTAEDVRYSFHDYVMNPELETESLRSILNRIGKVEVISERVCEWHFTQPDAFNFNAAMTVYVLPKHFYSTLTPRQINGATAITRGSGPWRLAKQDVNNQWVPGEDVVLVRNESYWGPAKPTLSRIRIRVIAEDTARLISFKNKEVDMILPSSPAFVAQTQEVGWDEKAHSLNWVNMRSGYSFIGWQCGPRNGKLTPFADKRVRQAMTMLLDRERMIRDIWAGIGIVATGPNTSAAPTSDPNIKPWPHDVTRAKMLLAEAGWLDRNSDGLLENAEGVPFRFEFTYAVGGQVIERIVNYVKDQCASIGIQCDARGVDWSQYDQILKTRDFDALTMGWSASAPESDPTQIWHTSSIQNQGHNFIQWDGGQDEIIKSILGELDTAKRMAHWHALHRLLHEEQPYTFVREVPWLRFISKDFTNIHPYPKGLVYSEFTIGQSYNRGM